MFPMRRVRADRGETLIELVISIAILGICVVAIGAGLIGTVVISSVHREQADASAILHNYAESLEATTYIACPATYSLPTVSGFQPPGIAITYWNKSLSPAGFQPTCPSSDQGIQQVTITLTSSDSARVSQSLTVVLRNTS